MILSFLLALSLSLDALGAGMACGLRRISLPIFSRVVLGLETAALLFLFLKAGTFLAACLPPHWAERGAALFLVGFGLFLLFQGCRKQTDSPSPLKFLRSPSQCDTDGSAVLEAGEALLLGLVLSADACGVGLSAAAAGFSVYWLPFFAALLQTFFLSVGAGAGKRLMEAAPMAENRYTLCPAAFSLPWGYCDCSGSQTFILFILEEICYDEKKRKDGKQEAITCSHPLTA